MTATSTLLAALIAASTTTNGVITVGDTQPFDQVRLYQNPANSTVLTNQSSDGSIDTSTTALVITGATAPTGLVFQPNLAVLRNVTSDIKLLVDTSVELTLNVNIAGTLTAMTVEAGKTAVLTLALIAGIPMIVGSHGFFPVATDGNGAVGSLLFIPTGAIESVDGEYQRFAHDGSHTEPFDVGGGTTVQIPLFYADLPLANRQYDLQADIKMPSGAANSSVGLFFAVDASFSDMLSGGSKNNLLFEINPSNSTTSLLLKNQNDADNPVRFTLTPSPTVGSVISLTTSATTVDLLWDGGSHSMNLPIGFFASAPNLLVMSFAQGNSPIVPLSIKVSALDQA